MRSTQDATSLTVPISTKTSNSLYHDADLQGAVGLGIEAPSALTNSNLDVQVSQDGSTWVNLQSGGADVTISAGKAVMITDIFFNYIRLDKSGGSNESAERIFKVTMGRNDQRL